MVSIPIDAWVFAGMVTGNMFFLGTLVLFGKPLSHAAQRKFFAKGKIFIRMVSKSKEVDTLMFSMKQLDKEKIGAFTYAKASYNLDPKRVIFNERIPEMTYVDTDAQPIDYFEHQVFDSKLFDAILLRVKASALPFNQLLKWLQMLVIAVAIVGLVTLLVAYMEYKNQVFLSALVKAAQAAATQIHA